MKNEIKSFLLVGPTPNSVRQNSGFFLLRFFVGLALCTVFEKFFPKNGIWGPQEWFIHDTANMGFPFPHFFAWVAVLSEFFGGILLMLGLFTRPAALLNAMVTFTATFIYHGGDIGGAGLLSFFFMITCFCIFLFGPGKISLDFLLQRKRVKTDIRLSGLILLLVPLIGSSQNLHDLTTCENVSNNPPSVLFDLKNNGVLPKKVTFIIYQPQQEGNNTKEKRMLPFQKVAFELPVGSKIYLATDAQINTVMQGRRIDSETPFLFVNQAMNGKTLKLNRRD